MSTFLSLPKQIKTARLFLRPWQLADLDDVMLYAANADWARYLPIPWPHLREHAEEFIRNEIANDPKINAGYAIIHEAKVVGGLDVRLKADTMRAELGYSIAPWLWGQGLMTEAVKEVINLVFSLNPGIIKISACADSRNIGSIRVMEKCGMQREALFRQQKIIRGETRDEVWCGILRRQWEEFA